MGNSSSSQVVPNRQQRPNSAEMSKPSDHTVAAHQTGVYPQLILFGDSITQNATLTLQPRLQALYVRRADVINRGFSGYNSNLALESLPYFLPFPPSVPDTSQAPVRLVTLFLGANDAALPCYAQHVPLSAFTANLERIVQYVLFQQQRTKIVVITPAPVDEWQLRKPLTRTAISTHRYARATKEFAKKLNLPCVDLWTAFARLCGDRDVSNQGSPGRTQGGNGDKEKSGTAEDQSSENPPAAATSKTIDAVESLPGSLLAPRNEVLATLLSDGIHFTPQGYDVLYDELMAVIHDQVPECLPENMPSIFESWRDLLDVPKEDPNTNLAATAPPANASAVPTTHPPLLDPKEGFIAKDATLDIIADVHAEIAGTTVAEHHTVIEGKTDTTLTLPHAYTSPYGEKYVGDTYA